MASVIIAIGIILDYLNFFPKYDIKRKPIKNIGKKWNP